MAFSMFDSVSACLRTKHSNSSFSRILMSLSWLTREFSLVFVSKSIVTLLSMTTFQDFMLFLLAPELRGLNRQIQIHLCCFYAVAMVPKGISLLFGQYYHCKTSQYGFLDTMFSTCWSSYCQYLFFLCIHFLAGRNIMSSGLLSTI